MKVNVPPGCISPVMSSLRCDVMKVEWCHSFFIEFLSFALLLGCSQFKLVSANPTAPTPRLESSEKLYWTDVGSLVSLSPFGLLKNSQKMEVESIGSG